MQTLLDRQDAGQPLSDAERAEAEGLVFQAEMLDLMRQHAKPKPTDTDTALARLAEVTAFRERLEAKYGLFPDSTLDIAADRRRDD